MDAIFKNVLRFMRDARSCQVLHADSAHGSGLAATVLPMDVWSSENNPDHHDDGVTWLPMSADAIKPSNLQRLLRSSALGLKRFVSKTILR